MNFDHDSHASSRNYYQHQQHSSRSRPRRPQHHHHVDTPNYGGPQTTVRQTPPSAQHYRDSGSRQERFREVQQGHYPATEHRTDHNGCGYNPRPPGEKQQPLFPIGLDYANDNDEEFRSPTPIVLDPNAVTPIAPQSTPQQEAKPGMMHNLLRGIGVSGSTPAPPAAPSFSPSRNHHHQSTPGRKQSLKPAAAPPQPPTATEVARLAPKAGFLHKLGSNITTYKRRFFILQPTTQLYYFVSPQDTTPRGAICLDQARVERLEDLPDGRSRLALHWPTGQSMQLEARSPQIADEWCASLRQERLAYLRAQLEESRQKQATAEGEIQYLKTQLEHFRLVEQDRDGALEDARRWKQRFEELDEAVRLLANHVRKLPPEGNNDVENSSSSDDKTKNNEAKAESAHEATELAKNDTAGKPEENTRDDKIAEIAEAVQADEKEVDEMDKPPTKKAPETKIEQEEHGEEAKDDQSTDNDDDDNNGSISRRDISLLDGDAATEAAAVELFEQKNIIEQLNAPGQHFPALINACQQLRENLRLASEEAATAVEDTKAAHQTAKTLQMRMTKAEKQLCQLWEENCSIRKTLKQKKREKRVLVREVKSLMEQQEQYHLQQQQQQQRRPVTVEDDTSTMVGSDEERLINELEEAVVSSIRLHEEFLAGGSSIKSGTLPVGKPISNPRKNPVEVVGGVFSSSSTATTSASSHSGLAVERQSTTSTSTTAIVQHISRKPTLSHQPISQEAQLASLFDRSASDSESEAEEEEYCNPPTNDIDPNSEGQVAPSDPPSLAFSRQALRKVGFPKPVYDDMDGRSISSVAASFGGDSTYSAAERSHRSTPLRPNPVLQLDQEEEEKTEPEVDETKHFKPINVADRGQATSRLVCPLADVVKTRPSAQQDFQTPDDARRSHQEELQIYHLTFYTRKIGLQFQKVPAPPTRARGLLTDAMTSDLAGEARGSSKTAAELKRVAAISTWAKSTNDDDHPAGEETCLQVATPIDAVLVCGFEGFDDTGNNVRPKLGARLVAFDGVSVEVGKWTFDSIRKAIQARGRPLTLSFRNDFLTTDQRAIMTKAVAKIEKDPPQATPASEYAQYAPVVQYRPHDEWARPPSVLSVHSAPSHETDVFVNETTFRTSNVINLQHDQGPPKRWEGEDDDLTVSTTGYCSSDYHHHPYHHRPDRQPRRMTSSSGGSYTTSSGRRHANYRSFSEAGSSASALSSAIGPLMSNLMSNLSSEKKKVIMNPDYLQRRVSVETTAQHQDFQSNLL